MKMHFHLNAKAVHFLCYPGVAVIALSSYFEGTEVQGRVSATTERTIQQLFVDLRQYQQLHSAEEFFNPAEATTLSPIMASGAMAPYTVIITPVINAGLKVIFDTDITGVRLSLNLHGSQKAVGRFFATWAELRAELLRSNILRPQDLALAESSVRAGFQWISPSPAPVADHQIRLLKLRA